MTQLDVKRSLIIVLVLIFGYTASLLAQSAIPHFKIEAESSSNLTNATVINQTRSPNFTVKDAWFEGGPVGYVLAGELVVTNCLLERSTKQFGYLYPDEPLTLINCIDDAGNAIT